MASRLLIGALLGATAATVYHKTHSTSDPKDRIGDIAEKANQTVDEAAEKVEATVDAAEVAVSEGIRVVGEQAHKLIGAAQERATGVQSNIKKAAGDYAREQAKQQLAKGAARWLSKIADEAQKASEKPKK